METSTSVGKVGVSLTMVFVGCLLLKNLMKKREEATILVGDVGGTHVRLSLKKVIIGEFGDETT